MTSEADDAGAELPLLERYRYPEAMCAQLWAGYRHASGPSALPTGSRRHVLIQDLPSTWVPTDVAAPLTQWSGVQICPGDRTLPSISGAITLLMMDVEPAYEEEFNAWYDTEHLPHVQMIPGIVIARRFRALVGAPRYLMMFNALEPEVTQRADFRRYFTTPWTQRLWPHTRHHQRFLLTQNLSR